MLLQSSGRRPRVVIVGAGFGGLETAQTLRRVAVDVTVVDRQNHLLPAASLSGCDRRAVAGGCGLADTTHPCASTQRDSPDGRGARN